VAFDRHWDLVAANDAMLKMASRVDIDAALLEPPVNLLRVGFHPNGLAPWMANLAEWRGHFLGRLRRQVATTGDVQLAALLEEVAAYPGGGDDERETGEVLGPLRVSPPGDVPELAFLGMFATFDTPFEVTASELAVELLFPADRATAEALRTLLDLPA
jgi:MmyB-like transcription regulator ligand binding domain